MDFDRERAVRHRGGRKVPHDLLDRLHLFERNRIAQRLRLQKIAQGDRLARLHRVGEPFEGLVIAAHRARAQHLERARVEGTPNAVAPVSERPAIGQR